MAGLAALVGVVAACSGVDEDSGSSASALAQNGRWALPSDVLLVGAKVHQTYVSAPEWTTTKACGGKLRPGSHVLGEYLLDHFAIITSIGGYACRRNTADQARMSVHGTGRALDVFIPMVSGAANNAQGDKVANWLVKNAQSIGVQLIIWDRSVWRANGTNDAPYGGPVPHTDHIHVELTTEAAAQTTAWFATMGDAGKADGGIDPGDPDTDSGSEDDEADASTPTPPAVKDAGKKDAAPAPPPVEEPDAAPAATPPKATEPPAPKGDPSGGLESAGDEPGETDSIPEHAASRKVADLGDPPTANAGCSAAPGSQNPTRPLGAGLALMFGLGAWLRRRKR